MTLGFSIALKRESSSAATICCVGELDVGSCRKLIDAIESVYQPELERLRVDLSLVTYIDATGIGCLIHADLQCRKLDVRLEIVPSIATLGVIRLTRLGIHLPLTDHPAAD